MARFRAGPSVSTLRETEVAIHPVTVSQLTCLAAYGVSSTWYLLRAKAGVFPSWRAGKPVLSLPSDFVAYLRPLPPAARDGAGEDDMDRIVGRRRVAD